MDQRNDYMVFHCVARADELQRRLDCFGHDWYIRDIQFIPGDGFIVVMESSWEAGASHSPRPDYLKEIA